MRFQYSRHLQDKVKRHQAVAVPGTLQLAVDGAPAGDAGTTYELVGVVYHSGQRAHSGHYFADFWDDSRGAWYSFDDDVVVPTAEKKAAADAAAAASKAGGRGRPRKPGAGGGNGKAGGKAGGASDGEVCLVSDGGEAGGSCGGGAGGKAGGASDGDVVVVSDEGEAACGSGSGGCGGSLASGGGDGDGDGTAGRGSGGGRGGGGNGRHGGTGRAGARGSRRAPRVVTSSGSQDAGGGGGSSVRRGPPDSIDLTGAAPPVLLPGMPAMPPALSLATLRPPTPPEQASSPVAPPEPLLPLTRTSPAAGTAAAGGAADGVVTAAGAAAAARVGAVLPHPELGVPGTKSKLAYLLVYRRVVGPDAATAMAADAAVTAAASAATAASAAAAAAGVTGAAAASRTPADSALSGAPWAVPSQPVPASMLEELRPHLRHAVDAANAEFEAHAAGARAELDRRMLAINARRSKYNELFSCAPASAVAAAADGGAPVPVAGPGGVPAVADLGQGVWVPTAWLRQWVTGEDEDDPEAFPDLSKIEDVDVPPDTAFRANGHGGGANGIEDVDMVGGGSGGGGSGAPPGTAPPVVPGGAGAHVVDLVSSSHSSISDESRGGRARRRPPLPRRGVKRSAGAVQVEVEVEVDVDVEEAGPVVSPSTAASRARAPVGAAGGGASRPAAGARPTPPGLHSRGSGDDQDGSEVEVVSDGGPAPGAPSGGSGGGSGGGGSGGGGSGTARGPPGVFSGGFEYGKDLCVHQPPGLSLVRAGAYKRVSKAAFEYAVPNSRWPAAVCAAPSLLPHRLLSTPKHPRRPLCLPLCVCASVRVWVGVAYAVSSEMIGSNTVKPLFDSQAMCPRCIDEATKKNEDCRVRCMPVRFLCLRAVLPLVPACAGCTAQSHTAQYCIAQ
jgi:hypothetical protein